MDSTKATTEDSTRLVAASHMVDSNNSLHKHQGSLMVPARTSRDLTSTTTKVATTKVALKEDTTTTLNPASLNRWVAVQVISSRLHGNTSRLPLVLRQESLKVPGNKVILSQVQAGFMRNKRHLHKFQDFLVLDS